MKGLLGFLLVNFLFIGEQIWAQPVCRHLFRESLSAPVQSYDVFLNELAPRLMDVSKRDADGFGYGAANLHSILRWLAQLKVRSALQKQTANLAVLAQNEFFPRLEGQNHPEAFANFYRDELSKLRLEVREDLRLLKEPSRRERWSESQKFLKDYLSYLKSQDWSVANVFEIATVGQVVTWQMAQLGVELKNPKARELFEKWLEEQNQFVEDLMKWIQNSYRLTYDKAGAVGSLERMDRGLDQIFQIESSKNHL